MRIASLIPSITETLIHCNIEVVARTRFCIHPRETVSSIPVVGGTKSVDWDKVLKIGSEQVILDKEENTLEMAESCPLPYHAIHIRSIDNVAEELHTLSKILHSDALYGIAQRWDHIAQYTTMDIEDWQRLPAVLDWIRLPERTIERIEYLIWRDPWMAIGKNTFIYSMLEKIGLQQLLPSHREKYPQIDLHALDPASTLLLFSSEPFPFQRYRQQVKQLGFPCAIVDGEKFSWYGIRSLEFLENISTV